MVYFVYCSNCASKDVIGAYQCTCSLVALRVPEMCFLPAVTRKKLGFFAKQTCLWTGAKIGSGKNEGNWLQLLFHFIVLMGIKASVLGMKSFMLCFRFQIEVFSYCTLTETFPFGFQKWFTVNGLILGFLVQKWRLPLNSYLHGLKSAVAVELFFFDDIGFSVFSLRGILVCCLKTILLFSHWILPDRLKSPRNAIQFCFLSFCVYQLFFVKCGKILWILPKSK